MMKLDLSKLRDLMSQAVVYQPGGCRCQCGYRRPRTGNVVWDLANFDRKCSHRFVDSVCRDCGLTEEDHRYYCGP